MKRSLVILVVVFTMTAPAWAISVFNPAVGDGSR